MLEEDYKPQEEPEEEEMLDFDYILEQGEYFGNDGSFKTMLDKDDPVSFLISGKGTFNREVKNTIINSGNEKVKNRIFYV